MTGFDEEGLRGNQNVIDAVQKCVALEGRDFTTIMDELVSIERQAHDNRAAGLATSPKCGALGPGVKEFRELLK